MMAEVEKEMVVQKSSNLKKQYGKVNFTGRGGFASVFSAKDLTSKKNESVAIKKLPHNTEKEKLNNLCEIAFLKVCVSHPNAVQYIKSFLVQPENEIWLVTEFLHGGTLSEAARVHTFIERHIAYVAREVLRALKFLHDNKFAHRDLKSTNVMMSINGSIKIIDFGLCADFTNGPRTNMVGSPFWIPPEMIKKEPHSLKVDCYSLAVCLLELFLMAPPHSTSGIKCMYMAVTKGLHDQIPKTASYEAATFLRKALEVDPEKRATANQLLDEPWVAEPGLSKGISEVLRDIFLTNTINDMGLY
uniref:Protein kinase domain-containing protein n=1 Tax=Arcella intermedia TaxID=1963864 RepID=A0A6B2LAQ7_9EUKA